MTFVPIYLNLYRVRVTSDAPGYRTINFDRRLFSAHREAAQINKTTDMHATVEAYNRHTGETVRVW